MLKNCLIYDMCHCTLLLKKLGVLKKRFPIIASTIEPNYCVETQNEIILAFCIFHNYLMGVDLDKSLIAEVDEKVLHSHRERLAPTSREDDEDVRQGDIIRDSITSAMW